MAMVKVCDAADVPGSSMKGFRILGKAIFVANVDSSYHCNDSTCTHRGGQLHQGDLEGATVTCPLHGSTFDVRDGKNTGPPAPAPIRHYRVEVRGHEIWADLG